MAKKTGYENRLAVFEEPEDGYKHLAVSVIERAKMDTYGKNGRLRKEARKFLCTDAYLWAVIAGGDKDAVREALQRQYAHS